MTEGVKIQEDKRIGPEDTPGYQIAALQQRVETLEAALTRIEKSVSRTIEWEEQTSAAGIQLQGLAKVTRRGTLLGITPQVIGPGNIMMLVTVRIENGDIGVISGPFKIVD